MGKKGKTNNPSLGRALIKDRFTNNKGKKLVSNNTMLHTTEVKDGYDWGRLNLQSVTEESSFQEFLSTAELAGTEFQAEKLNVTFVNPINRRGILTKEEVDKISNVQNKHRHLIRIPRRPKWDKITQDEFDQNEKQYFLEWRRSLAQLQEEDGVLLTPYEKNLEFWRQLWRVVERSDVIVQIVDARNPLLFRCEDLENYVKEVSETKLNMILLNKADFLTDIQRQYWADYFNSKQVKVVFFSALETSEEDMQAAKTESFSPLITDDTVDDEICNVETLKNEIEKLESSLEKTAENLENINSRIEEMVKLNVGEEINTNHVYNRHELLELFRTMHKNSKATENVTTIGLVGYPNVGKSSTINSLLSAKKVSVSATPGKTKHFQTLFIDKDLLLCDCPGLVMPSFVYTKAEMILNGILPIDQMRDHVPPINLVTNLIPRHILEEKYGLMLPQPLESKDADEKPTPEEFLNAYAFIRGFMTANGQPDNSRASRYILKDFVNGKLLHCHAPPSVEQSHYHTWTEKKIAVTNKLLPPTYIRATQSQASVSRAELQRTFYQKGKQPSTGVKNNENMDLQGSDKPWRINKPGRKKREKLRRVFAHLDQH